MIKTGTVTLLTVVALFAVGAAYWGFGMATVFTTILALALFLRIRQMESGT